MAQEDFNHKYIRSILGFRQKVSRDRSKVRIGKVVKVVKKVNFQVQKVRRK